MKRGVIYQLVEAFLQAKRASREERKAEANAANRTANATVWIAAFTFVSIAVGIAQWRILSGTLDEMQAEQRPWIKVEIEPQTSFPGGVKDKQGKIQYFGAIPINIYVSNVGHTPAFNIQPLILGYVDGPGHADAQAEQKRRCDQVAKTPLDNPTRGTILFPDEKHVPWSGLLGGGYGAAFEDGEVRKYGKMVDGHLTIHLWVIGCVSYSSGEQRIPHQTGFIYEVAILMPQPNGITEIDFSYPVDVSMPSDRMRLYPSPSSSVRTD